MVRRACSAAMPGNFGLKTCCERSSQPWKTIAKRASTAKSTFRTNTFWNWRWKTPKSETTCCRFWTKQSWSRSCKSSWPSTTTRRAGPLDFTIAEVPEDQREARRGKLRVKVRYEKGEKLPKPAKNLTPRPPSLLSGRGEPGKKTSYPSLTGKGRRLRRG